MINYSKTEGMPADTQLQGIQEAYAEIFGGDVRQFEQELKAKRRLITFTAEEDRQIVGFKIGYDRKLNHFYSWIGGVLPSHRGSGIASELMRRQNGWCSQNKYLTIRTQTKNKWKDMLILNLRHGYNVIGTYVNGQGDTKSMLEKRIN